MFKECTLSIIKPNVIAKNRIGAIYERIESAGFQIIAAKMLRLRREQAEGFYAEHKEKPFFNDLVAFMISGPIMVQVLAKKNAILCYRDLMGATNPEHALTGTLRADHADSLTENAVHGSDSSVSAEREIAYFFSEDEILFQN